MVAQSAAAKAGLILVPINPAFQTAELDYSIRKVQMKGLLMYDQFKTQNYHQLISQLIPEMEKTKTGTKISNKNYPYFDTLISLSDQDLPGTFKFKDIMTSSTTQDNKLQLENLQKRITMDNPACIIFTSGTTGKPKGATLSHHNVVNYSITSATKMGFDTTKVRYLCMLPLFHVAGCLGVTMNCLLNGNTVILTGPSFNPGLVIKAIENEKCSQISGTPTMFVEMLKQPDAAKTDFSSLKKIFMGAANCPPALLKRLIDEIKCDNVYTGYGASEISSVVSISEPTDSLDERLNTIGHPYPFVEIKIVNSEGEVVPRGVTGEIWVRSYKIMLGYWDDEEKTRQSITVDGWYKTGDVGKIIESGHLQIVDRIKDMIIRGGENIYPKEIEDFLMEHSKILEAYVIGVPDERMGEEVCAWVQLRDGQTMTEDELKAACKGKISHFKIPRYIRFVEQFPKTANGKVQKHLMRKAEEERKH
ncbi:hypothetical protein CHUAL_012368 [Chamberlinius hualienensis]